MKNTLEKYRKRVKFDKFVRVSHPNDCYPGNCAITGYIRNGKLVYEEQTGKYPIVDPNTPDWNPSGCARQCSYAVATYGEERIKQPMMQVGRGSGKWVPLSWDEAYTIIADKLIDAMIYNPQSILYEIPPGEGGPMYSQDPFVALVTALGGVCFDLESASIQDFSAGLYETFGKYQFASTWDDFFYSDLILIWNVNPAYSRQEKYHFLTESRYRGAEIVVIAPDYSPSAVHADYYIPVNPATDAALALAMCKVIIDENLVDWNFVKEQTDLPLLVRTDTKRFLRESDFTGERRDDEPEIILRDKSENFYFWDKNKGLVKAPRESLSLEDLDPVLEGKYKVEINGKEVEVKPVFEFLKEKLNEYTPEKAQKICGVHPDVIRMLARKVASLKTHIMLGFSTCKTFHGDLIERAVSLLLALTGNWGRSGTGITGWCTVSATANPYSGEETGFEPLVGMILGREATDEEIAVGVQMLMARLGMTTVPPVFYWYYHCGYKEIWEKYDLSSAGINRRISDYLEEAVAKGWWNGLIKPDINVEPKVLIIMANNTLRRTRGGTRTMLKHLWPKLDLIVTIDSRWSTTALYSDIVLPAAFFYEKMHFHLLTTSFVRFWSFSDKAIEPIGDSRNEWFITLKLAEKIVERAKERGVEEYFVPHGITKEKFEKITGIEIEDIPEELKQVIGVRRRFSDLLNLLTAGGKFRAEDLESVHETIVENCKTARIFSENESLESIRTRGFVKYESLGKSAEGLNMGAKVESRKTVVALVKHVEDKKPYPTLHGRAQFYIDHEWFLEAGEELPVHKPPPEHGGNCKKYRFRMDSGHLRWSIHASTVTNELMAQTHRGEPFAFINERDAWEKGIRDGDYIRVFNDFGEFIVQAKLSALPARGQIIIYHAWDPHQYEGWKSYDHIIP
ncbi:MAG: molybdopterin-dependent oxidoreductase, partial [Archaeoglobaceae archaeon]|nr:molybdopterin-dependent oxidoreductase [Archaeoglobaceae archaeon]